jgi:hypothetical protein
MRRRDIASEQHRPQRTPTKPAVAPEAAPASLLELQRSAGNRAVARLVAGGGPVLARNGGKSVVKLATLADFNDADPKHDPSRVSDADIQATDEYKQLSTKAFAPLKTVATPEEALLACRLMLRYMRDTSMLVVSAMNQAADFIQMARKQLGTLKETEKQVGHLNWTPFNTSAAVNNPALLPTEFGRWVLAGGPMPDKLTGSVNCWEMVLFGAFKAGFLSFARIQAIYGNAVANVKSGKTTLVGDTVQEELCGSDPHTLDLSDPNSPRPLAGDLVVFNKAAVHIAIATGGMVSGKHGVISLWNQPGNISTVQRTTVEDILAAMPNGGAAGKPVTFWTAKW